MLPRALPAGFIAPCLPSKTDKLPSGSQWLHEIKHDGVRLIARKSGSRVRLYSRPGNDFTPRFPLIVETLARLRSRSCIIDGEAVACDDHGGVERTLPLIFHSANRSRSSMLMLAAPEGAYANAALFIALARKLIAKEIISKEEMLGIFDDAATLLSGNAIAMRQALQLLPWLRKELGIAEATKDEDHQEGAREGEAPR